MPNLCDNGEAPVSFLLLTLSGGFDVVSICRLALSRLATRLRQRVVILICAFFVLLRAKNNTTMYILSSIILCDEVHKNLCNFLWEYASTLSANTTSH